MSFHQIEYNAFYYNNLCHVCKGSDPNLKRCSLCKTVAYCSRDHQIQDWKLHRDICKVITNTNIKCSLHCEHKNFKEFKKCNIRKGMLWQKELRRSLFNFECQMWMFPRVCAVCFNSNVTVDCPNCLNVSYCSELHKIAHEDQHSQFCNILKLAMSIDLYHFHKKSKAIAINVQDFDDKINILPSDLQNLMIMHEKNSNVEMCINENISDEFIQFVIQSGAIAPAATILYGLEKSGLLIDRLFGKPDLIVHIVGAEITEMGWLWKVITELPFHWIRNLRKLVFYVIGPQLLHNGVTDKFAQQLCDSCKAKHPQTKIIFHWKLYHEIVHTLGKPDIVIAFNSGLHVSEENNSWYESIDCLTMYPEVPLVLTAYTLDEIKLDLYTVKSKSKHTIDVILEPVKNPFSNMTPIRDWETENIPIFYVNGYITIIKTT